MDELRAEGQPESTGQFSLDLGRGRDLLARYTHRFPGQYLQNLVMAAVSRGATRWDFRFVRNQAVVEFDGEPLPGAELRTLLDDLLEARGDNRWLALGVLGASREGRAVTLENAGARLRVERDASVFEAGLDPVPWFRLTVDLPRLSVLSRLGIGVQEKKALHDCRFAPLALTFQGKSMNRSFDLAGRWAIAVNGKTGPLPIASESVIHSRNTSRKVSLALAMYCRKPGAWVLHLGVCHALDRALTYGFRALIVTEVALDLSGQLLQREHSRCLEMQNVELERSLVELMKQDESQAWGLIHWNWPHFHTDQPVMSTPLIADLDGALHTLGELRAHGHTYVAEGYPGRLYRGRPVFAAASLKRLGRRAHPLYLAHLPSHGWLPCTRRPRLPLPERYLLTIKTWDSVAGLTLQPDWSRSMIFYGPRKLRELLPEWELPGGLHLMVNRANLRLDELSDRLCSLYRILLRKAVEPELKLYHVSEYLHFVTRQFYALREGGDSGRSFLAVGPFEALLGEWPDSINHFGTVHGEFPIAVNRLMARMSLRFALAEFVRHPLLPGGLTLEQARQNWSGLSLPSKVSERLREFLFPRVDSLGMADE